MAEWTDRYGTWLISKLLQTTDETLGEIHEGQLHRPIAHENLQVLRNCLVALRDTLRDDSPERWRKVHEAAHALHAESVNDEVATLDGSASLRTPWPFSGIESAPPPTRVSTFEPHAAMGSTAPMQSSRTPRPDVSLPFSTPDAVVEVGTISLTLMHYAKLVAARARPPVPWTTMLARFGIPDEATFDALDHAWQMRLARHPDLQHRWATYYRRALHELS